MAKITRYDGNLVPFGINATGTNRTIFGSVSQSDDLTANIDNGSYKLGWEIVGPSDKPTIQDFSGATFTNAQLSAYLHQMGVAEWNDKQEYQVGSIANRAGVLYSCKTADHVSVTPPESDSANWDKTNSGIGVGEAWVDETLSRSAGITYTNTSTKTLCISIKGAAAAVVGFEIFVDGVIVATNFFSGGSGVAATMAIVPPGSTYLVTFSQSTLGTWLELK